MFLLSEILLKKFLIESKSPKSNCTELISLDLDLDLILLIKSSALLSDALKVKITS